MVLSLGGTCQLPSFLKYLEVSDPVFGKESNLALSVDVINPLDKVETTPYVVSVGISQVASPLKYLAFVPPLGTKPEVPDVIVPYVVLSLGGTCQVASFLRYLDASVPIGGIRPDELVVAAPYVVLSFGGVCHVASALRNFAVLPAEGNIGAKPSASVVTTSYEPPPPPPVGTAQVPSALKNLVVPPGDLGAKPSAAVETTS